MNEECRSCFLHREPTTCSLSANNSSPHVGPSVVLDSLQWDDFWNPPGRRRHVGSSQLIWNLVVFFEEVRKWHSEIMLGFQHLELFVSHAPTFLLAEGCRLSCLACSSIFWQIVYFDDAYWRCLGSDVARFVSRGERGGLRTIWQRGTDSALGCRGWWRVARPPTSPTKSPLYLLFY